MRTAIYTRVSKSDGSQDPENQLRELKVFCDRQGWQIVEVYTDHASGKRCDRASFKRMMLDASKRKFDQAQGLVEFRLIYYKRLPAVLPEVGISDT